MKIHDLREAFVAELQDMLGAEEQILEALPKMTKFASHQDVKNAFKNHRTETEEQIERVKEALESIHEKPEGKHCEGIAGILKEGEEMVHSAQSSDACDAVIIAANQKVEHYEIATYGTLCAWGEELGLDSALKLLKENLKEEKKTDEKLTRLAQTVNQQAQPTA